MLRSINSRSDVVSVETAGNVDRRAFESLDILPHLFAPDPVNESNKTGNFHETGHASKTGNLTL